MQASLRQLVEAAEVFPAAMGFSDEQGRVVLANRRTEEMFGYKRTELLGKHVELLIPEHLRSVHLDHRKRYSADPHTRLMGVGLDLMARRKDGGEFPVEISLSPIASDEGLLVVAMIHDISERKKAEERLRRSEEQLRHSQKMEGIARLASSIVHDFNNLIAVISAQTDLILDELGSNPLRAGYTVLQAAESTQAIQVCRDHRGSIDLVLTDIGLPGMRGPELVEQLKHVRPHLEALFMSGFGEEALEGRRSACDIRSPYSKAVPEKHPIGEARTDV